MAIFVLLMFLASTVTIAFAENDDVNDANETGDSVDNDNANEDNDASVTAEPKPKLKKLKVIREIKKERIQQLRKDLKDAKTEFLKAKKYYGDNKEEFLRVKEKLRNCKNNSSATEDCQKLNEEAMVQGKAFLNHAADLAIEHLNKIKARVQSSENIDDAEEQEIVADIDKAIAELEEAKIKVDAATTKEELKAASQTINQLWKKIKWNAAAHAARVINARLGEIIQKAEHIDDKLSCAVGKMEEQNASTDDVNELIAQFDEKISSAKTKYETAQQKLKDIRDLKVGTEPSEERAEQIRALLEEAKQQYKGAHKDLRDAYAILKEIIKEMRQSGVTQIKECNMSGVAATALTAEQ